jgi:hypothetical protein
MEPLPVADIDERPQWVDQRQMSGGHNAAL